MNKLNLRRPLTYQTETQPGVSTFPPVSGTTAVGSPGHLIVMIPADVDCDPARQRILELARARGMHIELLGLCTDVTEELASRRRLVTMASLMEAGKTNVEVRVECGTNWIEAVEASYQTGDAIVCFAEQRTGLLHRPLSQMLEANFDATVYILAGPARDTSSRNRLFQVGAWAGFLGIVVCFGMLQAKIVQIQEGWVQNILLILSTTAEFWLIWLWNGAIR